MATTKSMKIQAEIDKVKAKISEQQARLKELEQNSVRRVLISETMLAIPIEEVMRFGSPMLSPLE